MREVRREQKAARKAPRQLRPSRLRSCCTVPPKWGKNGGFKGRLEWGMGKWSTVDHIPPGTCTMAAADTWAVATAV